MCSLFGELVSLITLDLCPLVMPGTVYVKLSNSDSENRSKGCVWRVSTPFNDFGVATRRFWASASFRSRR
jgi:hypothetical protein